MLKLVVLLCFAAAVLGHTTTVNTCNNRAPLPLNVYVDGCTTPPCGLPQLSDAIINIVFKADKVIRELRARTVAYLSILPIPYDLGDQANACRGLTNSYCPLVPGEVLYYTLRMHIESIFPVGVAPNLEFSILDESNNVLFCIRLGIRVDPPLALDSRAAKNATLILN